MPDTFSTSAKHLQALNILRWTWRALVLICLASAGASLDLAGLQLALAWLGLLATAALALRLGHGLMAGASATTSVRLHDQALEVRRGSHSRFLVYENLRHITMRQGPRERVLSIELHTDDDAVRFSGLEGMEKIFTEVASKKGSQAMIEVEEVRMDLSDPLKIATAAALAAAVLGWFIFR